ncbi:MAG: hypothetical protein SWK76_15280 [Actinomycetota bacterium]|nr:hypothetical protein [Actinomycetota bacterium]
MDNALLSFFLGSLFGFLASIGLEFFRYYFFRPKLRIERESKEIGENFSCHSLVVKNSGRAIAKNAQGAITIHDITRNDVVALPGIKFVRDFGGAQVEELCRVFDVEPPESVYVTDKKFRDVEVEPIAWAELGSRRAITIFPDMSRLLDICRYVRINGEEQIQIPSSKSWQALLIVLKPNDYRVAISVGCDNGAMVSKKFTLKCGGGDPHIEEGW